MTQRYRIIRALPSHIDYLTASYLLEIIRQPHDTIPLPEWVFRARKAGEGTVCVIVSEMLDRARLLDRLQSGFEVKAGTPAAKLMDRLASDGIAEKARPSR